MSGEAELGVTGLAVMGQNLARNLARNGFRVAVHNRSPERTRALLAEHGSEGDFVPAEDVASLVASLRRPRALLLMVKAGAPVDDVIAELRPHLEPGDVLVDGGNSHFADTERRQAELAPAGIHFLGTGISGGEEGALHGPSIMPGGPREAYDRIAPVLLRIAAQVEGTPCCTYVGEGASGHYVKMVHNGIEYADMQLIAEAYDLMRHVGGLDNDALADVFAEWNGGELDSYLIEITARVFRTRDPETGGYLVDQVLDRAAQKGTGRWSTASALELDRPVTAIAEAVFARYLSALKPERVQASAVLAGPAARVLDGDDGFVEAVRQALYASKIVGYAQGFDQMRAAAAQREWTLDLGAIATIWRGGCIIRARFLDRVREAYAADPALGSLLLAPYFRDAVAQAQDGWRRAVGEAVRAGIPVPAFSSTLAYYDGFRRERLPANLIQAQRDLFGAHTYERVDRPGSFHSEWGAAAPASAGDR
jgi:6-phosphogluconate dehydrogenase